MDVPTTAFGISFDYFFLYGSGTLDVLLGDTSIFSTVASLEDAGLFQTASISVTDQILLSLGFDELTFRFEGPTGERFLLDNVSFPGFANGGFDFLDHGWFVDGPGQVELVGLIDEALLNDSPSVIPLPAAAWALLASLAALWGVGSRRGHA